MSEGIILGIDVGTNSVGWAVLKKEKETSGKLIDVGVRVFQEGVDRSPQGSEKSRNVQRREARGVRRIHQRKNRRRYLLKEILQEAGLLPTDKGEWAVLMKLNPYKLRKRSLDYKLSQQEFGRAIYHLAQRRGFKSNRKASPKDDEKPGEVQKNISGLMEQIEESGARTLGEHFAGLNVSAERIRGQRTARTMYEYEFDEIWRKQSAYLKECLTVDLKDKAKFAIFFQRPLRIQKHLIGTCEYEESKKRSPRGTWYANRFRMLQDINNLRVIDTTTGEERALTEGERSRLIAELGKKKEMKFSKIKKLLGLLGTMKFNLEEGGRDKLKGNQTEYELRQAFKKNYDKLSEEARDEIIRDILFVEDEDVLKRHAIERWKLDNKGVERLLKTNLATGYLHISEKALKKLLPYMEAGCKYMEAVEKAGYLRRDQMSIEKGANLAITDLPDLPNPLVRASLYQVRKVVNAIIREYGVPDKIRVEMVRDMKNPPKRRQEIAKQQRENEKRNEEAREKLIKEFGIKQPKGSDIVKYKLWEECNHECPYTGKAISREALFFSKDWEIEHIIPYPRSLDNSYMNKTLCWADENRTVKGNKTPWEAYRPDEKKWGEILKRIHRLAPGKQRKFRMEEIPDDFITRKLNDTAYIAREVRQMLAKLVGRNNVQIGKGQVTSQLRYMWGLNSILSDSEEKSRDDHRHHAIDAIVVALSSTGILQQMSRESAKEWRGRVKNFPPPYEGFRDDVKSIINTIVISHRVQRKVSGALHEETNYGILGTKDEKGQSMYALRKPVASLTRNEVEHIADKRVKEIIKNHLRSHGADPDKKGNHSSVEWKKAMNPEDPKDLPHLPNKNGDPVPIKKVRLHKPATGMIDLGYRAVAPGNNNHIVIYEHTEGKKKGRWDGEVVTTFEVARRVKDKEPLIQRDLGPCKKFIMSLSINEMVRIGEGDEAQYWRVQKMDGASKQITFRLHTAATITDNASRLLKNPNTLREAGGIKVTVNPIGRVFLAND